MNPARWNHRVSVYRRSKTPAAGQLTQKPYASVSASVACMLEPMGSRRRESLLGEISQAELSMECGSAVALQPEDLIVAVSGPGVTAGQQWIVEQVLADTMRLGGVPYQVAGLVKTARADLL